MKSVLTISAQTARRFVLGRQGLWPGRRWKGKRGTAQALRTCEAVQLDPLNITARSQDIVLHSRVLDYKPEYLSQLMYQDREYFDYGGGLFVYPMSELPYWRVHMERRSHEKRVEDYVFSHPGLFEQVWAELKARGPIGNRALKGNAVGGNYRGRKDTSLALFDMWLSGEIMIHHRQGFERVYDFREKIAPPQYDFAASAQQAEDFFARKIVAFMGLLREKQLKTHLEYYLRRKYARADVESLLARWKASGLLVPVQVSGIREISLVLAEDIHVLRELEAGKTPKTWTPIDTTTEEEVALLAPLDIVSARGRALKLFGFEYLWEVYKPAAQRRWGYYTLPILYGDDLVARLDPKLDRRTMTLQIRGFWHESDAPVKDPAFISALGRGLLRFADFLGANRIHVGAIRPLSLRRGVLAVLGSSIEVVLRPRL